MMDSIPRQFMAWADRKPDATAFAVKQDGEWKQSTWKQYVEEVRLAARGFMALGLEPGQSVGIMGFNRPQWTMSDLAAMSSQGVPVGVYSSCSAKQTAYILGHAGARLAVVESGNVLDRVLSVRDELPDLKHVIVMDAEETPDGTMSWSALLEMGRSVEEEALEERLSAIRPDDLGTLIYTSGTTGPPKGSMLSHGNLAAATLMGRELLPVEIREDARLLSYLPMAHAAERALTLLGPSAFGVAIYYAESIERMPANLVEVQPDVFLGVPRVWEKIHAGLTAKLAEATGTKARVANWSRDVGLAYHSAVTSGGNPSPALKLKYALASKLLFSRIRAALGLSRAQVLLTGAAPISEEVLRDLASLDLPLREVYGQTEGSGPTTNNKPEATRWGSVGQPFAGVELKIADDDEILMRSDAVFQGYYKDAESTADVLRGGWLHTGDLGYLDEDGYLYVTGRKKEIIITAGGKNISPRNIEEAVKTHALVNEAVVIGDRKPFLSILVCLEPEAELPADEAKAKIWEHVERMNQNLSKVEQVKKIAVLPTVFSVEGGELTPTLKLRRSVIVDKYSREIDAIYG
ncbi:MAG: long-chain fatty acid--CoA ligase [Rhodothermales bacterium]|nr:long-chain fatty acid--CoA ligase [Rhodothermales bacterium]